MIRFTVTDRLTGEKINILAPRRGEHVQKDGTVKALAPKASEVEAIMDTLKCRSKLGLRGGVLANA